MNTAAQAVNFIDSFAINWHGIDGLGEASNFIHSYKGIVERFQKLDTAALIAAFENMQAVDADEDEMLFTANNIDRVLSFLKEAKIFQESFLNLSNEPNFVENLEKLKKQNSQLNFINARSIIYHNCLA
ncbi:hypothetical protein [Acinetobacter ursingii]|uniref:hypothetical protein n=1 Tax=Acinetobacter ursingii TaxID=108980 RepID=UPI00254A34F1|nr:hypothetical protein [Acinetobacter ursingii]MEC6128336.1 hypothetical protein [Acinetobacter ursingii]